MGDDGQPYRAYPTLAAARADPDAAVVLEGDYGGQIYLTCPVGLVACDEHALLDLLEDLDRLGLQDPGGAALILEHRPMGAGDGPRLHPDLAAPALAEQVAEVLAGRRPRIATATSDEVVWATGPPWAAAPPPRLGVPEPAAGLLTGVLELLGSAPRVAGSLEVLGLGGWRLELPNPDGGTVRVDVTAVGARLALDDLPGEATFVFGADPVALGHVSDLVSSVLDRGVAVRSVLVDGERVASVVAGTRADGGALRAAWDREPAEVDWMRAALGPVERIGPLRGPRAG